MTVTRFVLLSLLLSLLRASKSHLMKCCPPGEVFSERLKVECVPVPSIVMEVYPFRQNATAIYQGIPQCDQPDDIMVSPLDNLNIDSLKMPTCLEIFYERETNDSTVIVVHCQSNKDQQEAMTYASIPQLSIQKCCSYDMIFDIHTKACVPQLTNSPSLRIFLPNESADADYEVIAAEGPPKCKGPIVDYEIEESQIFLRNDTYSVVIPAFKDGLTAKKLPVTEDNACLDVTPESAFNRRLVARVCEDPGFCDENACIRKCCAEDDLLFVKKCEFSFQGSTGFYRALTKAVSETNSSTFNITKDYGLLIGKPCKYGMFPVDLRLENWWLTSIGHVYVEDYDLNDLNSYCMDVFNNTRGDQNFHVFLCFEEPVSKGVPMSFQVNAALEFTSCAFLLMTLLVYACLPSLQNLHGKTLMCHVGSLFLAFTCLAIIPWVQPTPTFIESEERKVLMTCRVLAYVMLFSFLSAFFWLNIMCFDIWWTFGGLRGNTVTKGRRHRKRFLLYCLYAWGLSFLISVLALLADCTDILPFYVRPGFGCTSCWFIQTSSSYGELIFFIGPITIQLISNVVFFVLTSVNCNKVKAEIKRMTSDPADPRSRRYNSDRHRFIMNIKLFIVMGMSWSFEVMSFFLKRYLQHIYWQYALFYASDVFNCLQGLLIFILFVLKSRVYLALRKRLGSADKKKPVCNTTLQDPYRVKKSGSNSTIMSTFAVSSAP